MTFKERSKVKNSGAISRIPISGPVCTLKMTEQDFLSTLYIGCVGEWGHEIKTTLTLEQSE